MTLDDSIQGIRLRALELAKELVEGVRYDLEPQGDILWDFVSHAPLALEAAARLALAAEHSEAAAADETAARMRSIGKQFRGSSPWSDSAPPP